MASAASAPTLSVVPAVDFERFRLRTFVDGLPPAELERLPGATKPVSYPHPTPPPIHSVSL